MTINGPALTEAIYLILIHRCEVVRKVDTETASLGFYSIFHDTNTSFLKSKAMPQNILYHR